ncbi:hypothetical protein LZ30DRAFT_373162 [Colletotrichum cereale]|nr:hypothetical protein LZ30DRAFT_373162 [Colletotrichum cereale]
MSRVRCCGREERERGRRSVIVVQQLPNRQKMILDTARLRPVAAPARLPPSNRAHTLINLERRDSRARLSERVAGMGGGCVFPWAGPTDIHETVWRKFQNAAGTEVASSITTATSSVHGSSSWGDRADWAIVPSRDTNPAFHGHIIPVNGGPRGFFRPPSRLHFHIPPAGGLNAGDQGG